MTLEYRKRGSSGSMNARLVECPMCGEDLRGRSVVAHLRGCEPFLNWSADDATA